MIEFWATICVFSPPPFPPLFSRLSGGFMDVEEHFVSWRPCAALPLFSLPPFSFLLPPSLPFRIAAGAGEKRWVADSKEGRKRVVSCRSPLFPPSSPFPLFLPLLYQIRERRRFSRLKRGVSLSDAAPSTPFPFFFLLPFFPYSYCIIGKGTGVWS